MGRFELKKLESGDRFKLDKSFGLNKVRVELTWEGSDLDLQVWLLNSDGMIVNDEGFVFYNSTNRSEPFDKVKFGNKANWIKSTRPMSADGAVLGSIDALDGGIEISNIDLSMVSPVVQEIAVSATVYDNDKNFGSVSSAKVTIIDEDSGEQLCCYELSDAYRDETACVAGRFIVNDDGEWEFEADGRAYIGGLQTLVVMFAE